jgi:putative heme-binding domain-containing protein
MQRSLVVLACLLTVPVAAQAPTPPQPLASPSAADLERGHALFDAQCARCHGVGGTGGMGPPLNRAKLRRAPRDEDLISVLVEGVPGTAMGGAWQLSERESAQIAAFVRSLARVPAEELPGDPVRGRAIYEGKGACATCHIVRGAGRGQGPELTDVGAGRGSSYLRESLVDPGAHLPERLVPYEPNSYAGYLVVRAVTRGGADVVGTRVNEDSFTIQVRDGAGRLHSLRKAELRSLEKKQGVSLMPSYRDTLTAAEVEDLVAYLMTLRGEP